jgi:hypothetical protein
MGCGHVGTVCGIPFTISNEFAKTHADVVLKAAGTAIIEEKGKDPQTAAKNSLRDLKYLVKTPMAQVESGADGFATQSGLDRVARRPEWSPLKESAAQELQSVGHASSSLP